MGPRLDWFLLVMLWNGLLELAVVEACREEKATGKAGPEAGVDL